MRAQILVTAALVAFVASPTAHALNLTFLDQAPIRFFNETDIERMSNAADKALDETTDGEAVQWKNDKTGNSGTITPVRSYSRQGQDCRRLRIESQARLATRGSATSNVDLCKVEGAWKILTAAP